MLREAVTSSNVRAIGYDAATSTMEVEFLNGGCYQYAPVEAGVHQELIEAESVGRHFAALLRIWKQDELVRTTRMYPCCSEPFDSAVIRHECSTVPVS